MKQQMTLWYTRQNGNTVRGPFSESVLINLLLIGRIHDKDEVSTDQINWQYIYSQPKLQQGLTLARKTQDSQQLDERSGFDRRHPTDKKEPETQRRYKTRRADEAEEDIHTRQLRSLIMQKFRQQKQPIFWPLMILILVAVTISITTIFYAKPLPTTAIDCNSPAMPGLNWNNCLKSKVDLHDQILNDAQLRNSQLVGSNLMNTTLNNADMAYADLHFANLSYSQLKNAILLGANLKNADLSYSDLSNANLSYADLTNANLGDAKLDNARFDHAIWIDGQQCAVNSIGECLTDKSDSNQ